MGKSREQSSLDATQPMETIVAQLIATTAG
jgi:hypothetical protein